MILTSLLLTLAPGFQNPALPAFEVATVSRMIRSASPPPPSDPVAISSVGEAAAYTLKASVCRTWQPN